MNSNDTQQWLSLLYLIIVPPGLIIMHLVHRSAKANDSGEYSRVQSVLFYTAFITMAILFVWRFGIKVLSLFSGRVLWHSACSDESPRVRGGPLSP